MREGTGDMPSQGDTLLVDWDGYTIGAKQLMGSNKQHNPMI
jgi:hypothetical protein